MHVLKTISYSLFIFIIITLDKSEGGTFIIRLVKWQLSRNNQYAQDYIKLNMKIEMNIFSDSMDSVDFHFFYVMFWEEKLILLPLLYYYSGIYIQD